MAYGEIILAVPNSGQHRLGLMSDILDAVKVQKGRGSFDGVETSEYGVEQFLVIRVFLPVQYGRLGHIGAFLALDNKFIQQICVKLIRQSKFRRFHFFRFNSLSFFRFCTRGLYPAGFHVLIQ